MAGEEFLALNTILARNDDYKVDATLSTSLDKATATFSPLKIQILSIAFIALIVSALFAFIIARNITRPVDALVSVAERISRGDYSGNIQYSDYKRSEGNHTVTMWERYSPEGLGQAAALVRSLKTLWPEAELAGCRADYEFALRQDPADPSQNHTTYEAFVEPTRRGDPAHPPQGPAVRRQGRTN